MQDKGEASLKQFNLNSTSKCSKMQGVKEDFGQLTRGMISCHYFFLSFHLLQILQ